MQKSLFQRIKPEVLTALYEDQKGLPNLVNSITKELKETLYIADVRLGTATRLYLYSTDKFEVFSELGFYKLFN